MIILYYHNIIIKNSKKYENDKDTDQIIRTLLESKIIIYNRRRLQEIVDLKVDENICKDGK